MLQNDLSADPTRPTRLLALLTVIALVATGTVTRSSPHAESADVGIMSTSMVEMLGDESEGTPLTLEYVRKIAQAYVGRDIDGSGIDVALIDTGVAPVDGLDGQDKVLHGPDLSFEGASPEAAFLDTYGHGTHMAGIIAGERSGHEGVATGARLISIKTAGHDGVTTVPQVVAAIDWVVEHRNTDGLNIRVLNLSLGLGGVEDHRGDLLSAAVERAWDAGIFVVVAAGNDGLSQKHLDSPAVDPYVLAVGGYDFFNQDVPAWSANGNGLRNPDVISPARSIASYRVPGSTVDTEVPSARHGEDLFLGSGTSQAAAAASGLAALILQAQPKLSPDQLKATLSRTARDLMDGKDRDGQGVVNGRNAEYQLDINDAEQNYEPAAGPGTGIIAPSGATWTGGEWSGATWTGATWTGATWTGATWTGATWTGATWTGATWTGATWTGATWTGATWTGATWKGATWTGATWTGEGWS
ncbi:MAG: S8 family serine peptidase [Acidimicrobiales bacterium]